MKKSIYIWSLIICSSLSSEAQTTNHKVYSLFVVNIAKYASFPSIGNDFKIVVLGKSNVYEELQKVAATKDVNGKKMNITQVDEAAKIEEAQIIYLSDGKSGLLADVIKKFEGKPIMIISEREGLYKRGAGLSFVVSEDSKLRVDINKTDLEKRQIRLSQNIVNTLGNTII
ncbi:MAG: YfiR family protein [Cyclobacteriaceae bacterium]